MFPKPKNVDKKPCSYVYCCCASARMAKHLLAQFFSKLKIYLYIHTICFEPLQTSTPFWPKISTFASVLWRLFLKSRRKLLHYNAHIGILVQTMQIVRLRGWDWAAFAIKGVFLTLFIYNATLYRFKQTLYQRLQVYFIVGVFWASWSLNLKMMTTRSNNYISRKCIGVR